MIEKGQLSIAQDASGAPISLPLGITSWGRAWSEATLLELAYAYEQASKVRVAPKFAATVEV